MEDLQQRLKINGVKSGAMLGLIITALGIFSYYLITSITTSTIIFVGAPIFLGVFIPIFCVVMFCFNARKKIGGYWTFRQAVTGIFTMFIVAYLVQFIAKDIVFNRFIEPNSIQKTQTAAINAKTLLMQQRHASPKDITKDIDDMKKEFVQQQALSIGGILQSMVFSVLFIFLFSLIFASLFKKDSPGGLPRPE
ncbi:DUF4199 domain-containing protein [Mucilaginibacter xinganensis]|uniref:DUF4199 domain-containing protein n=1 Tax=Mucilaginibacter xinganensis TaxID=1234841 RepID=A0A223NX84_9SPHI|nr:DUF4199 domain-containing protein [Mucilaginibacter xinganensis]ASU34483.1 hypothetical protein MuYL_2596 [Mucilaginibacter xinganensis]